MPSGLSKPTLQFTTPRNSTSPRPTCHDLVEHKQDPFIPGKRMVDGYFHCSDCGWDGQIWEHIGFGDMLAYEAVHCPKCGAIIERCA